MRAPRPVSSRLEQVEAPYRGIDTESATSKLSRGFAPTVKNLLTGRPGRVPVRGPLHTDMAALWADGAAAIWSDRAGNVVLGKSGVTTLKTLVADTWVVNNLAVTVDTIPSNAYVRVGAALYGLSTTGHFIRPATALAAPVDYVNSPRSGYAVTYWKNRLWVLGGKAAGGATSYADRLYYSDAVAEDAALPDTVAAWQDDVSGLTNQIVLPTVGSTGTPVGFGRLQNGLLALSTRGGDYLLGTTPANASLRAGAVAHGCSDVRSIVEYGDTVMWLDYGGFYSFDGSQEVELSQSIRSIFAGYSNAGDTFGGTAVRLSKEHVYVTLTISGDAVRNLLLHVPTRSWSDIESASVNNTANAGFRHAFPCSANQLAGRVTAAGYDGLRVWALDSITVPATTADRTQDSIVTTYTSIAAYTISRLCNFAEPFVKSRVERVMVDHYGDWTFVFLNSAGAGIGAAPQLLDGGTNRQRTVLEGNYGLEVNDAAVLITFVSGTPTGTGPAELQDVFIEYTPAQQGGTF